MILNLILKGIYIILNYFFKKIIINLFYSITRDNASSNDTLISSFIYNYNKEGIKFQGDIAYSAYILNLVT